MKAYLRSFLRRVSMFCFVSRALWRLDDRRRHDAFGVNLVVGGDETHERVVAAGADELAFSSRSARERRVGIRMVVWIHSLFLSGESFLEIRICRCPRIARVLVLLVSTLTSSNCRALRGQAVAWLLARFYR